MVAMRGSHLHRVCKKRLRPQASGPTIFGRNCVTAVFYLLARRKCLRNVQRGGRTPDLPVRYLPVLIITTRAQIKPSTILMITIQPARVDDLDSSSSLIKTFPTFRRNSPKCVFQAMSRSENPPLIVLHKVYVQNNKRYWDLDDRSLPPLTFRISPETQCWRLSRIDLEPT